MRILVAIIIALAAAGSPAAYAQSAPSKSPSATTPELEALIRAGVELHDKGQYDQAIAKYQEALAKSPADVNAMFEMAFSYMANKDFDKSLAMAKRGAEFKSELLPMFYDVMASSLESKGQPTEAVTMYKRGIALAPKSSQLYYNLAVTYRESLGKPDDARDALKRAAALDPLHPGVHLLLGQVFQGSGYQTPAFLALSTFLVLDPAGAQALPGYGLWRALLKGGVDPLPDAMAMSGSPVRDRAMTAPGRPAPGRAAPKKTDEGNFEAFEALLASTHRDFMEKLDGGAPEIQALQAQVSDLLGALPARATGANVGDFASRHYVPFFRTLKERGFVEPFVYWASQRAPVPGVVDWLKANEPRVREFLQWASDYKWPTP